LAITTLDHFRIGRKSQRANYRVSLVTIHLVRSHVRFRAIRLAMFHVILIVNQIVMSQVTLMCGVRTPVPRRARSLIARLVQLSVPMTREAVDVHAFA
jgi:hypothetical protein